MRRETKKSISLSIVVLSLASVEEVGVRRKKRGKEKYKETETGDRYIKKN